MIRLKKSAQRRMGNFLPGPVILIIFSAYLFLAFQKDLRFSITQLVMVSGVILVLLVFMLFLDTQSSAIESPWFILLVAVILRLLFVFRPPELSDDIFRYAFDGLQSLAGNNPYALPPLNAVLPDAHLQNTLGHINHPDLVTIYPPGAQMLFLLGTSISKSICGIKLVLITLDLATCSMILYLLSSFHISLKNSILYAWHPQAVMEIAGSGHIDAAAICFFFVSISVLTRLNIAARLRSDIFKPLVSGLFYGVSILVKLFPLVYFPFFLKTLRPGHPRLFLFAGILGSIALCIPYLPDLVHMADTLFVYARHWEFSGLVYRSLIFFKFSGGTARLILSTGFLMTLGIIYFRNAKSDKTGTNFHALEIFLFRTYQVTLAFLIFTPTFHPWYALYLVVLLPFFPNVFGIVLSWSVLLSYRVLILYCHTGQWIESDLIPVLIWAGPLSAFFLDRLLKFLFKTKNQNDGSKTVQDVP